MEKPGGNVICDAPITLPVKGLVMMSEFNRNKRCSCIMCLNRVSDILNSLLNPGNGQIAPEFVMEVTDKTRADVKVLHREQMGRAWRWWVRSQTETIQRLAKFMLIAGTYT